MAIRAYSAAIDGVGCARELVIGETADPVTITCSSADGAFLELAGVEDWEGYYSAYGGVSANGYPNDALSLVFNIGQDVNEGGSGPAIIEAVRVDWDFERNWPIQHVVKFAGNGALEWGEQTTSDATTPSPLPSNDGKISVATPAAEPSFTDLSNLLNARLTIFADIAPYADSSTSNGKRRAAGPLGWKVEVELHTEDPSSDQSLNGESHVRMYIDSTNYWDVQWVIWKKIGDVKVVIDGREYIKTKYEGSGTGYVDISDTWTKGQLVDPASSPTSVWPEA